MPPVWPPLPDYCSAPALGAEGFAPLGSPKLTLHAAAVVIRHGDRSAIHALPHTNETAVWDCRSRKQIAVSEGMRVIALRSREALDRSFASLTAGDGTTCLPGQLTPKGIEQHLQLGRHLRRALAPLLTSLAAEASATADVLPVSGSNASVARRLLFARSTDYTRTILSLASLLHTLLPSPLRKQVDISVEEIESQDILHGVGLASSSKVKGDGGGEKERRGSCAAAVGLAKQQIRDFRQNEDDLFQLEQLFGKAARNVFTTHVADALYARACHGFHPPCSSRNGCVGPALSTGLWAAGDEYYCSRYGRKNGRKASALAMYPFISEILERLSQAAEGTGERLIFYSGHDTVIAPVLAALGGMQASGTCRWPPYASHIVFEVWRSAKQTAAAQHHVRLLFNGLPVTSFTPGCAAAASLARLSDEFCPLPAFAEAVRGLLDGHSSFEEACVADVSSAAAAGTVLPGDAPRRARRARHALSATS